MFIKIKDKLIVNTDQIMTICMDSSGSSTIYFSPEKWYCLNKQETTLLFDRLETLYDHEEV